MTSVLEPIRTTAAPGEGMGEVLERQRASYLAEGPPPAKVRIERMDRLAGAVVGHADALADALSADFGHRSAVQSLITDVIGPLPTLEHTRLHLRRWMRPSAEGAGPLAPLVGRARIRHDPLGVVGIISPWNFPVTLAVAPAAQALAAGNRVMLKLSELVPRTSEVMRQALEAAFDPVELAVVTGDAGVGAAFSRLPFDHLLFTGSTAVGRHVQRAAADNLVPVTLELGGKCPVVMGAGADLAQMAARVMTQKLMNAGQICLSPDHLYVPAGRMEEVVDALVGATTRMYPTLLDNPDYTSVVNEAHRGRLAAHVADARAKGARIVEINPASEDFSRQDAHKLPPTIILGARPDMTVMQEEIFGPLLPVIAYDHIEEVLADINRRPHPLALYYFGHDATEAALVADGTRSGGMTVNDVLLHYVVEGVPFGGVGASGMGYYHGKAGFATFTHARPVVTNRTRFSPNEVLRPPFTPRIEAMVRRGIRAEAWLVERRLRRGS